MTLTMPLRGSVFVACGENGLRAFSRDGKVWTHLQTDREGVLLNHACFFRGQCYTGGRYGGELTLFQTADGLTWQSQKLPSKPFVERLELLFATDTEVCAIISTDGAPIQAILSKNGRDWSPRQTLFDDRRSIARDAHIRRVARGNDRIVLIGDYGVRLSAPTLHDKFIAAAKAEAKDTLIDITFGNGVFVGGGLHALRMRSRDGRVWTDRTLGEEGEHINRMIFDGKQFLGIGQGATYRSVDGVEWERIPNQNAPTVAAYGDGIYVGALWPGKLLHSRDAIHWNVVQEFPQHVHSLEHGVLGIS